MFALSDNHTPNSHNGKGFWARLGHILYHKKPKNHSSALNDQLTEPADFSALSDCGCLPPEAMSDGKPKRGVKMPSAEDIARANKLNHRFAKFHKQLGATYRAFCGGKNGFMVKRYVESCLSDGTPKINTTDMKPIGVGPASLVNFEKWHGISFHQFETADESEVAQKLKAHNAKSPAAPASSGGNKSKANSTSAKSKREEIVEKIEDAINKLPHSIEVRLTPEQQKKYRENEQVNYTSENTLLIAETSGNQDAVNAAKLIVKLHKLDGGIEDDTNRLRRKLDGIMKFDYQSAAHDVAEVVQEAKEQVEDKKEEIQEAEKKIKKVQKQRAKKEVTPAKAKAVIEKQKEIIAEAKEEIAEVKAEVKQEIAEVKSDDDDDDIAALIKSFSATVASL